MAEEKKFDVYIRRIGKQIDPDYGFTGGSLRVLDSLVNILVQKLMVGVNQAVRSSDTKTIKPRDVQTAAQLILPGDIAKHAVSQGARAVTAFNASTTKKVRKEGKAGLVLSVSRIDALMRRFSVTTRSSESAAVYMTAVVEFLLAEIIEPAFDAARAEKRRRVKTKDITLAVYEDEQMDKLLKDVYMAGNKYKHGSFYPKKGKKGKKSEKEEGNSY